MCSAGGRQAWPLPRPLRALMRSWKSRLSLLKRWRSKQQTASTLLRWLCAPGRDCRMLDVHAQSASLQDFVASSARIARCKDVESNRIWSPRIAHLAGNGALHEPLERDLQLRVALPAVKVQQVHGAPPARAPPPHCDRQRNHRAECRHLPAGKGPHDVRTWPASHSQLWLGRCWLLCSVYIRGAAEHSNMLCTEGWMQLAKRKLEYHHACKPAAEVVQAPASQALTAMRVPPTAMHGYQLDHRQQLNRNATPGDATGHAADRTTALAHTAR